MSNGWLVRLYPQSVTANFGLGHVSSGKICAAQDVAPFGNMLLTIVPDFIFREADSPTDRELFGVGTVIRREKRSPVNTLGSYALFPIENES